MTSYAQAAAQGFNFGTTGGILFDQGAKLNTEIGNKYKDNETIGSMVAGNFIDAAKTQMNTGLALQYNTSMSSHLANLQMGMENLKTGNQLRLMGAEGRIAKDLIGAQGEQQRMGIRETGAQQRMNIGAQGVQDRMNIGAQGIQDRMNIQTKGGEDRKSLVVAGQQERLNIGKRYSEERNMRADARGAIRSMGARFFG